MSGDLTTWLDAVERKAEFDAVAAASACAEDIDTILRMAKILRAADDLATAVRDFNRLLRDKLTIAQILRGNALPAKAVAALEHALAAYDAAVADGTVVP